jgi:hypothetical protein
MTDVFDTPTTENPSQDVLSELVGEGKKFADVNELAKGKQEADNFIEQIQAENKTIREALAKLESQSDQTSKIEELIESVRSSKAPQVTEESNHPLSEDDLSNKIKEIMQGESRQATAAENRSRSNSLVLGKVNGDVEAAKTYVAERAKQLGMSAKDLGELSERSPNAFAKLIDVDPSTASRSTSQLPSSGQVDTSVSRPMEVEGHKTKAYYDHLKQEMGPTKYWNNVKVQGAYTKDAIALGDRFNK